LLLAMSFRDPQVLPENLNLLKGLTLTPHAIILDDVYFDPCSSIVMRPQ
jgi:hypothetical protein